MCAKMFMIGNFSQMSELAYWSLVFTCLKNCLLKIMNYLPYIELYC